MQDEGVPEGPLRQCCGTPSMGVNLWGESPLYELGSLKEANYAKWITPIDKVRGEGNCGRVTDRGKEAGAKTCEATNRNVIEGRVAEASGPSITKPFPKRQSVNGELVQGQFTLLSGEG